MRASLRTEKKIQNHLPLALYDPRSDPYPKLYWKKKMMYHHCRQGMEICSTSKLPLSLVNKRADRPYAHSVIDQVKNGKTISDRHTHIFSSQDYIQTFRWFIIFINSCVSMFLFSFLNFLPICEYLIIHCTCGENLCLFARAKIKVPFSMCLKCKMQSIMHILSRKDMHC